MYYLPYPFNANFLQEDISQLKRQIRLFNADKGIIRYNKNLKINDQESFLISYLLKTCSCGALNQFLSSYCRACQEKFENEDFKKISLIGTEGLKIKIPINHEEIVGLLGKVFFINNFDICLLCDEIGTLKLFFINRKQEQNISEKRDKKFYQISLDLFDCNFLENNEKILQVNSNLKEIYFLTSKGLKVLSISKILLTYSENNILFVEGEDLIKNSIRLRLEKVISLHTKIIIKKEFSNNAKLYLFKDDYLIIDKNNSFSSFNCLNEMLINNSDIILSSFLNHSSIFINKTLYLIKNINELEEIKNDLEVKDLVYYSENKMIIIFENGDTYLYNTLTKSAEPIGNEQKFKSIFHCESISNYAFFASDNYISAYSLEDKTNFTSELEDQIYFNPNYKPIVLQVSDNSFSLVFITKKENDFYINYLIFNEGFKSDKKIIQKLKGEPYILDFKYNRIFLLNKFSSSYFLTMFDFIC